MGSGSCQKSKRKRKLSNDQIEVYRERDRECHRRRRQGMLNIANVTSTEEEIEFENVPQVIENENVDFESENIENFENVESDNENAQHVENFDIGGENVENFNIEGGIASPSEPYVTPNYFRNEDPLMDERQIPNPRPSRTPKWLFEIDENIITNLEGKRSTRTVQL